jgi:glycosyltransferase involved in cell wall biosynthesis
VLQVVKRRQLRGAEVFAFELSEALERRGHVTAVAYLYDGVGAGARELRSQDSALGGEEDHPAERLPGFQPRLLRRLERTVASFRPDIVQVNGSRTVKYGGLLRWRSPRSAWGLVYRSIGTSADWLPGRWRPAIYGRLVLSRMDGIAAVTRDSAQRFGDRLARGRPCVQIPRGVDLHSFVPAQSPAEARAALGTPAGRLVVLFVGSLSREKRPDRAVRLAGELARRGLDVELWVIGDGPLRAEVERAAAQCAATVRMFGSRRDVATLMGAADLLVLTSDTEGTPGVVLEAAAVGLPVIATRVGGVAECLCEGSTGMLVPAGDESAMVAVTAGLLADPATRSRMAAEGPAWVSSGFSLDRIADRYLELYENVLRRRRGVRVEAVS